jgi:hypothetical protein
MRATNGWHPMRRKFLVLLFALLVQPCFGTIQYSVTQQTDNVTNIVSLAGGTAYLLIYTGSPPAHCSTSASGTLLVSLPMSSTIGTVTSGVLTMSAITSENATNSGTAGYWRIATSSAGTTVVAQGTVGTSGADLNFSSGTVWTSGQSIGITSFTITANGA